MALVGSIHQVGGNTFASLEQAKTKEELLQAFSRLHALEILECVFCNRLKAYLATKPHKRRVCDLF